MIQIYGISNEPIYKNPHELFNFLTKHSFIKANFFLNNLQ